MTGKAKPSDPSSGEGADEPVDSVVQGCPCQLPSKLPKNPESAPDEIQLPKEVDESMQESFKNSFPGGKSQERGATLVKGLKGKIKVVHESAGDSGSFSPNRQVGFFQTIVGTYHTHPYDASEGGHKGVSFSGGDIAYSIHHDEPVVVDAGDKQFIIMPTKETPDVSSKTINDEWDAEFYNGLNAKKSMQEASADASKTMAKKYKMVYYDGDNGNFKKHDL